MQMTQYRLFFSWQNDRTEIKAVISSALKKVADKFAKENVELIIDQDTRGRVGVRNIAIEVLDKIRNCDIFVADLTPITTYIPKIKNIDLRTKRRERASLEIQHKSLYRKRVIYVSHHIKVPQSDRSHPRHN